MIDIKVTAVDTEFIVDLVKEVSRLQKLVKKHQVKIDGHRSHLAEVLQPNGCEPTIDYDIADRSVKVMHNHSLDKERVAEHYPIAQYPTYWEFKPDTDLLKASLKTSEYRQLTVCGDYYVKVA